MVVRPRMHLQEATASWAHWAAALGCEGKRERQAGSVRDGGKMTGTLEAWRIDYRPSGLMLWLSNHSFNPSFLHSSKRSLIKEWLNEHPLGTSSNARVRGKNEEENSP